MEILIGFIVLALVSSYFSVSRASSQEELSYKKTVNDTKFNRESAGKA